MNLNQEGGFDSLLQRLNNLFLTQMNAPIMKRRKKKEIPIIKDIITCRSILPAPGSIYPKIGIIIPVDI